MSSQCFYFLWYIRKPPSSESLLPSIIEYAGITHWYNKDNSIWRNDEISLIFIFSPLSFCTSDIEECAKITCNCSNDNATCKSSEGSFKCVCKPGFSGDRQNCTGNGISSGKCVSPSRKRFKERPDVLVFDKNVSVRDLLQLFKTFKKEL